MIQDTDASALAERIAAFKSDPQKLREATEFVDELIQQAQKQAELKQKEKDRSKFDPQDPAAAAESKSVSTEKDEPKSLPAAKRDSVIGNLKRRLGRARGFVLRMFDALCNCTQTAAAAARTTARNNPFTKR